MEARSPHFRCPVSLATLPVDPCGGGPGRGAGRQAQGRRGPGAEPPVPGASRVPGLESRAPPPPPPSHARRGQAPAGGGAAGQPPGTAGEVGGLAVRLPGVRTGKFLKSLVQEKMPALCAKALLVPPIPREWNGKQRKPGTVDPGLPLALFLVVKRKLTLASFEPRGGGGVCGCVSRGGGLR